MSSSRRWRIGKCRPVELAEDPRERSGGARVDHELTGVRAPVEAPVADREQAQVRQADGAARPARTLGLQLGLDGGGQPPRRSRRGTEPARGAPPVARGHRAPRPHTLRSPTRVSGKNPAAWATCRSSSPRCSSRPPGLNALANWLEVPYPIPLVIGGLVLGLVPGIPDIQLDPDLVLLVFLPPLLYSSAFFADLRALRDGRAGHLPDGDRARPGDGGGGRRDRPRADRPAVGDVVRARRDRLADRPGGGDGDHAPRRRAAADGQRPRGREPVQRRHRARRLQGRGGGGHRRERLGRAHRRSSSSATPAGGSRSGWRSAGRSPRSASA